MNGFIRCGVNNYEIIGAMAENFFDVSYDQVEAQRLVLKIGDAVHSGKKIKLKSKWQK